ncbi:hypothetical protein BO85DRAFT_276418 [Aspergillus piperis CBS 112811]|uniref:Uncharacterized protein n=1 Tax=Aspergillus piperis CBS 112811 TaxID=1448313 RepID=A0A8G1VM69_9EURO|nr:hypothetical protein BO85DRAFT_276418 [Aspergillus piperis CBS 112811]RAH58549.1 hypothetical protein BO85DRAFT_276418 [Aspergillus piperis CBS 112811]
MDDGGGKFDHGVCLVLVCTRSRLSPPPFKALTGRWSRDKTEAPSTGRGGNADSYFAGGAGGGKITPLGCPCTADGCIVSAAWESVSVALTIVMLSINGQEASSRGHYSAWEHSPCCIMVQV